MPPVKKAAKKAKPSPKHDEAKELRRAYEHRGRIEVLRPLLGKNTGEIDALVKLAEQQTARSQPKNAADLLRAAEHFSFGYLAASTSDGSADAALLASIEAEFKHKLGKAGEHWEQSELLSKVYQAALDGAHKAFDKVAFRKALELVRTAEAIAHVDLHEPETSRTGEIAA